MKQRMVILCIRHTHNEAIKLARIAGEEHRVQLLASQKALLANLDAAIDPYSSGASDDLLLESLIACKKAGLLTEGDINSLGYRYLNQVNRTRVAEIIFKANTIMFPDSPNTYDSYADSLIKNGKIAAAVSNYEKAVILATQQQSGSLSIFQKNLEEASKLIQR